MAIVDLLSPGSGIPPAHATRDILVEQLKVLSPAVVANADSNTGAWPLVISQPLSRKGNYIETSGTNMFVYSLLKAIRLGLVGDNDGKIMNAAKKAYEYIVKERVKPNSDGTIDMEGTVRVGSLE